LTGGITLHAEKGRGSLHKGRGKVYRHLIRILKGGDIIRNIHLRDKKKGSIGRAKVSQSIRKKGERRKGKSLQCKGKKMIAVDQKSS